MPAKKVEIGESGRTVALNVAFHRASQGMTAAELAAKVNANGRALAQQTIGEIENLRRRCDVDDLIALAQGLGVSPATLLMPRSDDPHESVAFTGGDIDEPGSTGRQRMPAHVVWQWLCARMPLIHPSEHDSDPTHYEQYVEYFDQRATPAWSRIDRSRDDEA
ncbi:hypothetical protein GCM10027169_00350 [Gordonia jinhuaensis]|uniref:HTH cro/C1-type domain-containing protein n=1 Tax=Gordonia jinhuaensis TaxID=1517702 RepID=A0A916SUI9_9ACTN|nr:helix-turn-helix transcriptional regulator [Gordonia jinhuaensis]GGB18333.1 hypothetical protein GCM10011489_03010 [Gordonia jinhuaensis]